MELGETRQYVAEGIAESEACGNREFWAEFLWNAVQLNIIEGYTAIECLNTLQVKICNVKSTVNCSHSKLANNKHIFVNLGDVVRKVIC